MKLPPTLQAIERNLADGLRRAKTTELVRYRRHRTKPPDGIVNQLVWVDLAGGRWRALDYDASGRLTGTSVSRTAEAPGRTWNPSGACGCDLDPFTNFPGRAVQVSLLADQTIDRQATLHLRVTVTVGPGPSTTDFWIARSTHLPVRSHVVYRVPGANGRQGPLRSTTDEFTWLPRTSANLDHVTGG